MRFWFADSHFDHHNIIAFCNRPFVNIHHMAVELEKNWCNTVVDTDEVWILGDVAMGATVGGLELLARLPGRKYLKPGNHDKVFGGNDQAKIDRWRPRYEEAGIEVLDTMPSTTEIHGVSVTISHFPPVGDSRADVKDRFVDWRPRDDGGWFLHGHVHDRWRQKGRYINVGVDAWNFTPVSDAAVLRLIQRGPRDLRASVPTTSAFN